MSTFAWKGLSKRPSERVVDFESHRLDTTTRLMVIQLKGTEYRLLQVNNSVLLLDNIAIQTQTAAGE